MTAFQILQGIETLALRMDRICDNALAIAHLLKNHPKVAWVNYAGLPDHRDHALVQKYMGGKASGIISFGVKSRPTRSAAAGARVLRMRCSCSRGWSISATPSRWPAIRPPPRTAS